MTKRPGNTGETILRTRPPANAGPGTLFEARGPPRRRTSIVDERGLQFTRPAEREQIQYAIFRPKILTGRLVRDRGTLRVSSIFF